MEKVLKIRRMRNYLFDFCKRNPILILFLLCALLFDTLSTIYFMNDIGIECELNPMVRLSALFFGPITGTFLTAFVYKAIVSVLMAAYLRRLRMFILVAPAITSTFAGFFNFFAI